MSRFHRINLKTATLEDIYDECEAVHGTPYGHNMIGIMCGVVSDRFGKDEADELFNDYQG